MWKINMDMDDWDNPAQMNIGMSIWEMNGTEEKMNRFETNLVVNM